MGWLTELWTRRRGITLRARAALLCVTLFAIFYGAIVLSARQYRSNTMSRSVDENLTKVAETVAAEVKESRADDPSLSTLKLPEPEVVHVGFMLIRDSHGRTLRQIGDRTGYFGASRAAISEAIEKNRITLVTARRDSAEAGGERSSARIITLPAYAQTGELLYVQVGVVPDEVAQVSRTMLDMLVYTFPGALLAAFCTGWVLAGYALEPLKEVSRTVEQMSVDRLDARIPTKPNEAAEITEMKERLNAALERMQRGYQAHDRFISNVAHDLRTPIATMLTESQVIRMTPATVDDFRRYASSVEDEMRRLGRLVESFLMLARAEHGAPITTSVDAPLNDLLAQAVRHATPLARLYHVSIRTSLQEPSDESPEPIVAGDPDLLRTMIENLIQNALKFSPRGGVIDASVGVRAGETVIAVRDRGPGIPEDLTDTVFERFTQAPTEVLQFRGAGLGLSIARSVAVIHHGRISAHNCEDGGCVFEVFLPLAAVQPDPETAVIPEQAPISPEHATAG